MGRFGSVFSNPASIIPGPGRDAGRIVGRGIDDLLRDPRLYGQADIKDLVDGSTVAATAGVLGRGDRERGGLLLGAMLGTPLGLGALGTGAAGWYLGNLEKQRMEEERLLNEQEAEARRAGETQARQIAQVRTAFGELTPGMSAEGRAAAHERRATFGSLLSGQEDAIREGATAPLLEQAANAAQQGRFSAARAGQLGSSIDAQNRRNVLESFTAGRANIASGVRGFREQAQNNLTNERVQMEAAVRQGGSAGLEQTFAAQRGINALRTAEANVAPAMFGNLLGQAGQVGAQGVVQGAQGNAGLTAFGLPNIGGSQNKTAGALTSNGKN